MPKKTSNTNDSKEFNQDREFGVILESLRSEFKVFGEDLSSVKTDLNATKKMVAKNSEDITMINIQLAGLKTEFKEMKSDVGTLKSDVNTLKSDLVTVKDDIKIIKNDFGKRLTRLEETLR